MNAHRTAHRSSVLLLTFLCPFAQLPTWSQVSLPAPEHRGVVDVESKGTGASGAAATEVCLSHIVLGSRSSHAPHMASNFGLPSLRLRL